MFFVLNYRSPQLVNLLITFVTSGEPVWRGYLYTVLIFLSTSLVTILNSQSFYRVRGGKRRVPEVQPTFDM